MEKNKAEKVRSQWFPGATDGRSGDYTMALDRATRNLSTRSCNVLKTVVATPEGFAELFGPGSGLRQRLLTLRNLGMRSVMELEAWWEALDPGTREVLMGTASDEPTPDEGGEAADWLAMRLALTVHTLSVRSQNVLNSMLPNAAAYRERLVLTPSLEQELYAMRNLGRKSVEEICDWVARTRQELLLADERLHTGTNGNVQQSAWTRLTAPAMRALHEVLGLARMASLPPQVPHVATPEAARDVHVSNLLDALLFRAPAVQAPRALEDPHVHELVTWLGEAPVEALTPLRLQGIWSQLVERIHRLETPHIGSRFANEKALRDHLIWGDTVLRGVPLEALGEAFGISRERARQIKVACDQRLQPAMEEAVLDDFMIEETGQIWAYTENAWQPQGPTDALLWAGLAVRQRAPHRGRIWMGRRQQKRLIQELNAVIERMGVKDEAALLQAAGAFFDGCVAPRPVLECVEKQLAQGLRPTALLRKRVLALLHAEGKALSMDQIQARLTPAPNRNRLHSQILRLSKSGALVSIGKRGYYMRPIPGFNGTSFQYDDAAQMYLAEQPKHCACIEEILEHYVSITGIETSLHSFHTSLQIQAEKPDSPLVLLPFYHIGLKRETADLQRRAAHVNAPLITANLNHLRTPIPEPGSAAAERLIERFAQRFQQDPEFIAMAITHRHWSN